MEHSRGGDQPSTVLNEVLLPRETSGDFARIYLERVHLSQMSRYGDGEKRWPFSYPPECISRAGGLAEYISLSGYLQEDEPGSDAWYPVYEINLVNQEDMDTLGLDHEERAALQVQINQRAAQLEEAGDSYGAHTLRFGTLSVGPRNIKLAVSTSETYLFSSTGGSSKRSDIQLFADGILISPETPYTGPQVKRGSDEWELESMLATVTLGELTKITDKMTAVGMLPIQECEAIRKRYPEILGGAVLR